MRALAIAMLFTATAARAAPVPKELKEGGLGQFVGVWVQTGSCLNGGGRAPADGSSWKFDAAGKAAIFYRNEAPRDGVKFRLDPDAKPKTIDWICPWGNWYGVYELEGDTLTVYLGKTGGEKGRNWEFKAGPGISVYSFKRSAAAK